MQVMKNDPAPDHPGLKQASPARFFIKFYSHIPAHEEHEIV